MRHLKLKIISHIFILCILIGSASWAYWAHHNILATVLLLGLLVLETVLLFRDLDGINRKMGFFFEAVKNEDMSLRFPESNTSSTTKYLHREMNRVNQLIQQTRIKQIEQEQFFQLAMNHAATGLLTINEEGFIPFANHVAKVLLNYSQLSHLNQLKQIDPKLFQAIGQIKAGEKRMVTCSVGQSSRELVLHATSFRNRDEQLRIISVQNLKTELDQKESEAWIKLIRVLSHEMINTIAPISSLAETLSGYFQILPLENKTETLISTQQAKNTLKGLKVIQERGRGLVDFVERYRQLTRLPQPQKELFLFLDLAEQLRILMSNEANLADIHFIVDVQPQNLEIFADKAQISQALLNILLNAFQAVKGQENAEVHLKAFVKEGKTQIGIMDNGPGIPEVHLSDIFIPFFTTKENGSGIGLSLSRQIIQQHGMSLEVQSIVGEGTSFWIEGINEWTKLNRILDIDL